MLLHTCRRLITTATTTTTASTSRSIIMPAVSSSFKPEFRGRELSSDFRVYYRNADGVAVSPFHDIPLWADKNAGVVNMVCEIPRWSNAKMEISKDEPLNPILQDTKKGKLRFVRNHFPNKGYIWNYGAIPQTWEDPSHVDPVTKAGGDNDPLDVCEIGNAVATRAQLKQVKVLGVLAMLDDGETDWKIIAIDVNDPDAHKMNNISDVEKVKPGLLDATREWFRNYKIPDGKPKNNFAFNEEFKDRAFALGVIAETSDMWSKMIKEGYKGLSIANTTVNGSGNTISSGDANKIVAGTAAPAAASVAPADVDEWHFI